MDALTKKAISHTILFLVAMWFVLFVPAWSLTYWQGWVYWLLFSAFTLFASWYFATHDPALVQRRMRAGATAEKEPAQKIIMALASVCMVALLVVPALDHLLGWSRVPPWLVIGGDAVFALGYAIALLTMHANTFAAATITVEENQRVISTGPYALVRHPMYSGALLMFGGTPLGLGSYWGLIPAVLFVFVLAARLLHEEHVLSQRLPGYDDYRRSVRSRLVPMVW